VTAARSLSDTFAGIAPANAPAFVIAELAGALAAWMFFGWLLATRPSSHESADRRAARLEALRSSNPP
jgi:hypothetical protein